MNRDSLVCFLACATLPTLLLSTGCLDRLLPSEFVQVAVTPTSVALVVGDTLTLRAAVMSADGRSLNLPFHWSSSDDRVVSVSGTGLVRGTGQGLATIHLAVEGVTAITEAQVRRIGISSRHHRLMLDDTLRLEVTVVDDQGRPVPNPAVHWTTSNSRLATVDSTGLVRGIGVGSLVVVASAAGDTVSTQLNVTPWTLVGAGDIADCGSNGDEATADILDSIPGIVFTAGDNAYPYGSADDFTSCYGPSWGRHKSRTRPSPGNHDYDTPGASPYFAYFGANAGDSARGYYSYDIGSWHIVVLNSAIDIGPASRQLQWLRDDLGAHRTSCTLAYFHHPLFSSGAFALPAMRAAWQILYDSSADVVLSGHDHIYERFAPQTPSGQLDTVRGIRQFIIGTGGRSHHTFVSAAVNSETRDNATYGVLELSLFPTSYRWRFLPASTGTYTDSGSGICH